MNGDDTLLYETDVEEGQDAVYVGETPTKEEDEDYTYIFDGWDHSLENVQEDFVTKALFRAEEKEWSSIIWF